MSNPPEEKKNYTLEDLDSIIREVRRSERPQPAAPGAAAPENAPVWSGPARTAASLTAPEPEPLPGPEAPSGERSFPLPENVEELAAHFAPERGHSQKDRREKKARRREEKEQEKQDRLRRVEEQRKNAAAARKAAREPGEYVPRRMAPQQEEEESQRIYREAMDQYGAPARRTAPKPKKKPAPEAPAPAREKPKKPRLHYDRFHKPCTDLAQAVSDLQDQMLPLAVALIFQCAVLAVAAYLTVARSGALPLPPGFTYRDYPQLYGGILAGLQALGFGLCWEVHRAGLWRLLRLRPTPDTLVSLALTAALTHSVLLVLRPVSLGPYFPLALPALFLGAWATYAKRQKVDELRRRYKMALLGGAAPQAVKLTWDKPRIALMTEGNADFDTAAMADHDRAEAAGCIYAPLALLASVGLALYAGLQPGADPYLIPWRMTLLLLAVASPALLSAGALPGRRCAKWLWGSGAALLSWRAARELSKAEQILLRDNDLYPPGMVHLRSLKVAEGMDLNRVLVCAAGLTAHIGGGLDKLFQNFAREQYLHVRPAEDFQLYENGGASAMLDGDSVLMGSAPFLTRMGVRVEEGMRLPHGIFLAINSRFAGVFEAEYKIQPQIFDALGVMGRAKLRPLLGTLDFTVTPLSLETKFHLKADWCLQPDLELRYQLHEPAYGREAPTLAILNRDNALPFAEAVLAAKKLTKVTRSAVKWGLLSGVLGLGLMYMLASGLKHDLATPLAILAYYLLWLAPVHLLSWLHIRK